MGRLNVHKPPGWSQLSKIDTGTLERNNATQTCLVGRPHMEQHGPPDQTMPQWRKQQMGHLNMNKASRQSQLNKTDTGALEQNVPTSMCLVGRPHTA